MFWYVHRHERSRYRIVHGIEHTALARCSSQCVGGKPQNKRRFFNLLRIRYVHRHKRFTYRIVHGIEHTVMARCSLQCVGSIPQNKRRFLPINNTVSPCPNMLWSSLKLCQHEGPSGQVLVLGTGELKLDDFHWILECFACDACLCFSMTFLVLACCRHDQYDKTKSCK